MGCTQSDVPDPNLTYGNHANKQAQRGRKASLTSKNTIHPGKKGHTNNNVDIVINSNKESPLKSDNKDGTSKVMKGDIWMYNSAKLHRERKINAQMKRRDLLAQEMSTKAMDDMERLSLSTSRSRTTSRNTSPRLSRDPANVALSVNSDVHSPVDDCPGPSNQVPSGSTSVQISHEDHFNTAKQRMQLDDSTNQNRDVLSKHGAEKANHLASVQVVSLNAPNEIEPETIDTHDISGNNSETSLQEKKKLKVKKNISRHKNIKSDQTGAVSL